MPTITHPDHHCPTCHADLATLEPTGSDEHARFYACPCGVEVEQYHRARVAPAHRTVVRGARPYGGWSRRR